MAQLHAVEGPLEGRAFKIPEKDRVIVGRYEVYDLIVPDPSISRKHFALEMREDGLYLVDLGSLNGTRLNGHRVSTARLERGDRIGAGESVLAYDETDSATPPAPSEAATAAAAAPDAADDDIEPVSDEDIIAAPAPAARPTAEVVSPDLKPGPGSPATVPMPVAKPPSPPRPKPSEAEEEPEKKPRKAADKRGTATTKRRAAKQAARASAKASAKEKQTSGSLGRCAACGKRVTQEQVAAGEGSKTRLGYVCGRCIEKRQKAGGKGSLEKFIMDRQRRRR